MTRNLRGDTLRLELSGNFTVAHALIAEAALTDVPLEGVRHVDFCMGGVDGIDSAGAWLIHRERAKMEFAGRSVGLENANPRLKFLLAEIERHISEPIERPTRPFMVVRGLMVIGETMAMVGRDAVALLSILGVFGLRLATAFTHFRRLRITSILANFDRTCRGAVPIVMLMSFLIGLIIAQQGGLYLQAFGADLFVVDLAGVLILREIGVLLAAILVAGRSGSAFTAEIGSMRMREEVDALNVLGLDPVEVLVVPRLIALVLALPVLTFLSDIAALVGAALITWAYLDIPPDLFLQRLNEAVTPVEFYVGMAKAPFMAMIIGLVACMEGLKVGGSSESLGRHTTSAVVKAIFLVIVVDGLFAVFFGAIGI
ncbi:MAG: MlaE family lipid ABC transporter permease subunit [Pseudomonadota bacterium]